MHKLGATFAIVDNRVLSSFSHISVTGACDFAEEAANTQLSGMYTMILSRLLLLSSEHENWVPAPRIYKARSINEVMPLPCDGAHLLPSLSQHLEAKQCGVSDFGPATSWRFITSGLRAILNEIKVTEEVEKGSILILVFTNDRALITNGSNSDSIMTPHHLQVDANEMQTHMRAFEELFYEIGKAAGIQTRVELRLVMGSISSLPGHGAAGLPASFDGSMRGARDHEMKQLSNFFAALGCRSYSSRDGVTPFASYADADSGKASNCEASLLSLAPSTLMFEDILRSALVFHSPKADCVVSFPRTEGMSCELKMRVSAATVRGASALSGLAGGHRHPPPVATADAGTTDEAPMILEVVREMPRTAVPVNCLEGTNLQLSAAHASCFPTAGGANNADKHNRHSVSALLEVLRKHGAVLLVRMKAVAATPTIIRSNAHVRQPHGHGGSYLFFTYWALVPTEEHAAAGGEQGSKSVPAETGDPVTFSLMRLVDKESFLIDDAHTGGVYVSRSSASSSRDGAAASGETTETAKLISEYVAFFEKSLSVSVEASSCSGFGGSATVGVGATHLQGVSAVWSGNARAGTGAAAMYNPLGFPGGEVAQQVRAVMDLGTPMNTPFVPSNAAHDEDNEDDDRLELSTAEASYLRRSMDREAAHVRGVKQTAGKISTGKPLPKPVAPTLRDPERARGGSLSGLKHPSKKSLGSLPPRKPLVVRDATLASVGSASTGKGGSSKKRARVSPSKASSKTSTSSGSHKSDKRSTRAAKGGTARASRGSNRVFVLDSSSEELESVSVEDDVDSDDTEWAQMH